MAAAKARGPKTVVAVGAAQDSVLGALDRAEKEGIARSILIGSQSEIVKTARAMHVDLSPMRIINEPNLEEAAQIASWLLHDNPLQTFGLQEPA